MMSPTEDHKPAYIPSLLQLKCPCCRTGHMFVYKHSYSKNLMQMHEHCEVCGQPMEIEPDFYYGTGYVSYALSVAISVASFIAWWVIVGLSLQDNRFFWWIGFNAVLLVALQPYLMRLSRAIWLSFFVKYKKDAETGALSKDNLEMTAIAFEPLTEKSITVTKVTI